MAHDEFQYISTLEIVNYHYFVCIRGKKSKNIFFSRIKICHIENLLKNIVRADGGTSPSWEGGGHFKKP